MVNRWRKEKDEPSQNENEGGEKPKRKYVGTKFKLSKEDYQRVMARKSGLKKKPETEAIYVDRCQD